MLQVQLSKDHLPLVGYFLLIGALLFLLSPALLRRPFSTAAACHVLLACASLAFTWRYMFLYFQESFISAALRANVRPSVYSTQQWLESTSLFNEAWSRVCSSPLRWWWSQQLCAFTASSFTAFLFAEAQRKGVKRSWAYMLLGQVVAVSFSQTLFCAALALSPKGRTPAKSPQGQTLALPPVSATPARPSWLLCGCTLTSLATVALTPLLFDTPYFLPNLLLMHALLVLPLLPPFAKSRSGPISYSTLYLSFALISLLLRLSTYSSLLSLSSLSSSSSSQILATLAALPSRVVFTLFEHPAQSSIGFDVVFASASFVIWMLVDSVERGTRGVVGWIGVGVLGALTPVVGVAVTGSLYLAKRELEIGAKEKKEKTR